MGGLIICSVISLIKPQNYDWQTTREIPTIEENTGAEHVWEGEDSLEAMDRARKIMLWVGWGLSILLVVVWPLLALPAGVFSKSYFT